MKENRIMVGSPGFTILIDDATTDVKNVFSSHMVSHMRKSQIIVVIQANWHSNISILKYILVYHIVTN